MNITIEEVTKTSALDVAGEKLLQHFNEVTRSFLLS